MPEKDLLSIHKEDAGVFENIIVNNIKCELHRGVQDTLDYFGDDARIQWLKTWGATVTLKISVDEKSGLNPGVSLTTPLENSIKAFPVGGNVTTPQSIALALGGSGSADATRVETIAFTYSFKDLLTEGRIDNPCDHEDGVMIQSDLKIGQFIFDKSFIATVPGSVESKKKASPFSVFSYQLTFVASFGGNITPTWKFARISVNPTSPFFNASRTKTNDVTVTLGPATPATAKSPAQVSPQVNEVHFAKLIGQAVATAIQSQQH